MIFLGTGKVDKLDTSKTIYIVELTEDEVDRSNQRETRRD